jgi:hypothetical protein
MTDEKKLKQCLQVIISAVSKTNNNFEVQINEEQLINDLKVKIKKYIRQISFRFIFYLSKLSFERIV